jgi:outer membrane immunogenic protein
MKKLVFAAVALAVSSAAAMAADLPARPYTKAPAMVVDPAYDWSGFYIGGHIGYLWGKTRVVDDGVLTESGARTNGVVGGVLAGYNWQTGPVVFGLEGDIGAADGRGHGAAVPPPPPIVTFTTPNSYHLMWTSHIVGKLGYASGSWLFFVTGGLGMADLNFREGTTTTIMSQNLLGIYTGFSVGAGIEHAFTRNLIGRVQYIYDDFGSKNYTSFDGGIYRLSFTSQTLRGALSWKF